MRETKITLPELVLIAGTRAALGAGVGLLLADRLSNEQRRAVGWTLFLFGALSTIPLAFEVFGGHRFSAARLTARIHDSHHDRQGGRCRAVGELTSVCVLSNAGQVCG